MPPTRKGNPTKGNDAPTPALPRDEGPPPPEDLGESPLVMNPPAMMDGPGPSWSGPNGLGSGLDRPGSPSGIPSTPSKPPKITRKALREYAGKVIDKAGELACHLLTARDSIEREMGLWRPDEEDRRDIADPLAGLASRRVPDGPAGNPDVVDGFALALALFAYVGKQLARRAELRTQAPQAPAIPDMTEDAGDVAAFGPDAAPTVQVDPVDVDQFATAGR